MPKRQREDDSDDALDGDGMTAVEGEGAEQERPSRRGQRNSDDKDIDSFMSEMGEDAEFVSLRRYDSAVSDWVILAKLDASEATAEAIKARFGGGKYRARIIDSEGRYKNGVTFRLAGASINPDEEPASETKSLQDKIAQLEKAIAEKNGNPQSATTNDRLMEAIVTRLLAPPVQPQRDPLMETLITALLAGRPSSGQIDPVELQKLLQGARQEGYTQGKELGEALSLADAGDASVPSILAREVPKLTEILIGASKREATTTRKRIASPNPPQLPATPVTTPIPNAPVAEIETVSDNPIAKYLSPVVPVILGWARKGKTPEVKAVNMLDDLTDAQKETIGSMAENEDFVQTVMAAVPQLNAPDVKAWVEVFLKTVQDTLAPAEDESAPETTAETVTENGGETITEA